MAWVTRQNGDTINTDDGILAPMSTDVLVTSMADVSHGEIELPTGVVMPQVNSPSDSSARVYFQLASSPADEETIYPGPQQFHLVATDGGGEPICVPEKSYLRWQRFDASAQVPLLGTDVDSISIIKR